MIIIPDAARSLLERYIYALKCLKEKGEQSTLITEIEIALEELEELYNDLDVQKLDIFQGDEKEVMRSFIGLLDEKNIFFSADEKYYYFSKIAISVDEECKSSYNMIEMLKFMSDPAMSWCDGGEVSGFNREFRFIASKDRIPKNATELPTKDDEGIKLFYKTKTIKAQLFEEEWNRYFDEFLTDEDDYMDRVYRKWYGVDDVGVYYILS